VILRKPYAFLIKYFRLIHLILAVFVCYSIYRTKVVLDFFNEYVGDMVNVIGQELQSVLIPVFFSFVPILIIIFSLLILFILTLKKKPNLFYLINIIIYIFVIIVIGVASSTLSEMETVLLDVRTIRLVRDFIILAFAAQFVSAPIIIIRTVGFDIKKFNFKEDLKELEIDEEDREEFEVEINIDKNKVIRNLRRRLRYFIYSYKENRLLYNIAICGVLGFSFVYIIFNFWTRTPNVKYNTNFSGNGFTMSVLNAYLVDTGYKGNTINKDYSYLLLKIRVKNNTAVSASLDVATTKIVIGNYYYVPTIMYKENFFDFGEVYANEKIGSEYVEKVLLYEIPNKLINDDMVFSYVNKNSFTDKEGFKSTNVAIKYTDLNGVASNEKTNLGQTLYLDESILPSYKVTITGYEISNKFKLKYNHCILKECIESYEYLTPSLNTNYDKTLLKINGSLEKDVSIEGVVDLYDFINKFGKIRYEKDGVLQLKDLSLKQVKSKKVNQKTTFYIEVPKEIEKSKSISIIFKVRNRIYEYVLK